MNLEQFLDTKQRARTDLGLRAALGAWRIALASEPEKNRRLLSEYEAVIAAFDGLQLCDAPMLMTKLHTRWMFVAKYGLLQEDFAQVAPLLNSLECVVIPEGSVDHNRHFPCRLDDLATVARGACIMRTVRMTGREIAEEVVAMYAANVRIGEYEDVLIEMCRGCGEKAVMVCEHRYGLGLEDQSNGVSLYRLCVRCPRLEFIAENQTFNRPSPLFSRAVEQEPPQKETAPAAMEKPHTPCTHTVGCDCYGCAGINIANMSKIPEV